MPRSDGDGSRFLIIPAIDLIEGRCVRLREGEFDQSTVYDGDPVDVAQRFADAGASLIHVVDLDAARGSGSNLAVLERICARVDCRVEVGGGVRSAADVRRRRSAGADRIAVGTALVRAPDAVASWAAEAPDCLVASIDARDGRVHVSGWTEDSGVAAIDLARRARSIGCIAVEYTNIARDGMLTGPDIEGTAALAAGLDIPVILSGGVARTGDAAAVREAGSIAGMIVGRAIYEGAFDLRAAYAANGVEV